MPELVHDEQTLRGLHHAATLQVIDCSILGVNSRLDGDDASGLALKDDAQCRGEGAWWWCRKMG